MCSQVQGSGTEWACGGVVVVVALLPPALSSPIPDVVDSSQIVGRDQLVDLNFVFVVEGCDTVVVVSVGQFLAGPCSTCFAEVVVELVEVDVVEVDVLVVVGGDSCRGVPLPC